MFNTWLFGNSLQHSVVIESKCVMFKWISHIDVETDTFCGSYKWCWALFTLHRPSLCGNRVERRELGEVLSTEDIVYITHVITLQTHCHEWWSRPSDSLSLKLIRTGLFHWHYHLVAASFTFELINYNFDILSKYLQILVRNISENKRKTKHIPRQRRDKEFW